jgi:hypothetical protein
MRHLPLALGAPLLMAAITFGHALLASARDTGTVLVPGVGPAGASGVRASRTGRRSA